MRNKAKGFVVVNDSIQINGINYSGVNTDAWPIGTNFDSEAACNICEMSYLNLEFPMLVDFESAVQYCRSCEYVGIRPRLLFCEVLINHRVNNLPQFENTHKGTFLGFDYAYPSGDYYSVVVNDIICKDKSLLSHWMSQLNEFGLLPTEDKLLQFLDERETLAEENKHSQEMIFEKGNFVEFALFLVDY